VASGDDRPLEILVLGRLALRRGGTELLVPTKKPAEVLLTLALADEGRAVDVNVLRAALSAPGREITANAIQAHMSTLRKNFGIPIVTGSRGSATYQLRAKECWVDAREFVAGVDASRDMDELMRMWRQAPAGLWESERWVTVTAARSRLIQRIAAMPHADRVSWPELDRFTALFPGDAELDVVRRHGRGARKRLLVVEDDESMLLEICARLAPYYRYEAINTIEKWRAFRDIPGSLDEIDGALIDLHLTETRDDKRGLEIVKYLRDKTEIPVALVTANPPEHSHYGHDRVRHEFRLVDIVDKHQHDWWEALDRAAALLVGDGDDARRQRLESWLETTWRNVRRDTANDAPGSIGYKQRKACDAEYAKAIGYLRVAGIDEADECVNVFYQRWRRLKS
jgi:hypothetical protein